MLQYALFYNSTEENPLEPKFINRIGDTSYLPISEEESSLVVITEGSRRLDFPTNNFSTKQSNIDRMATALITSRKVGKSLAICRISENKSVR